MASIIYGNNRRIKALFGNCSPKGDYIMLFFEILEKSLFRWKRVEEPLQISFDSHVENCLVNIHDEKYLKKYGVFAPTTPFPCYNYALMVSVMLEFCSSLEKEGSHEFAQKLHRIAVELYNQYKPTEVVGKYIPQPDKY